MFYISGEKVGRWDVMEGHSSIFSFLLFRISDILGERRTVVML